MPPTAHRVEHREFRAWAKLAAGMRQFGAMATLRGACRLAKFRLLRSQHSSARSMRDGLTFGFRLPAQCPTALVLYGALVEPEYEFVRRLVAPGSLFVDVGAGIGTFSLVAARHGARVHAFEPHPGNAATIAGNVQRNLARPIPGEITVHAAAVSDRDGAAELELDPCWFRHRLAAAHAASAMTTTVPTTTLATFCANASIDRIDLLKVDVEGHEHRVLLGAGSLLRDRRIGAVIVEMGRSYAGCRELLEACGYTLFFYLPGQNRLEPMAATDHHELAHRRPSGFHCNVVALPDGGRAASERIGR